ncbi:hypothetical protein SEA_HOLT_53 [Mycobacterium Phage Holt]|nr:hypothetical protein SEA_YASSJOHNNY_44 [Mycobacterium phage YassJohnny]AXC37429.1 hypothetical protein SEA_DOCTORDIDDLES_48 [Mycobacterium phage DoctorDiddles]AYR00163.1 hypothetical protein PBI_PAT3_46 [Mycobacterium phage Pat3]QDF17663.1 hypothetical protein SEA_CHOTABHAI_48 [Mycobacterium phage ChotaBhai]WNM73883.1 hypothetical protein SEA_HOLT_53 [Mycobacterium Phage Holt]
MPAPPCNPGCTCGKHRRTKEHNTRIGMSVQLTVAAKKAAGIHPHKKMA